MKTGETHSEDIGPRYESCWACRVTLQVPKVKNQWAEEFKCGWCGAVTNTKSAVSQNHTRTLFSDDQKKSNLLVIFAASVAQVLIVVFVVSLLLSIMIVGFFALLPNLYRDPSTLFWNQLITVFLSFNIICNYTMALVKGSKSRNTSLPSTEGTDIPKGIYDNYRYCVPCQSVKAPDSHHCSACNACIEQMDHHCPFIGNCVGRRNLHNFLLFLFWTAVGAIYAMIVSSLAIVQNWPSISRTYRHHRSSLMVTALMIKNSMPWWVVAAFLMLLVCIPGMLGILVILISQLEQIRRGQTYVESLKTGAKPLTKPEGFFMRLAHVLGGKNPLFWLFPFLVQGKGFESLDCKVR